MRRVGFKGLFGGHGLPFSAVRQHGKPHHGYARRLVAAFRLGPVSYTHLDVYKRQAWYIRNVDTGEQVKLASSVTSTSTVRVDMALERATVNSQAAAVTLDSDFFTINGRTTLQLSGGSAVLEWRERWL